MSLPTSKIGSTDVTAIGYGFMGLSGHYGVPLEDEERLKVRPARYSDHVATLRLPDSQLLDALFASGCTMWDTADVYGDSEDLLGRWWVFLTILGDTTARTDEILQVQALGQARPSIPGDEVRLRPRGSHYVGPSYQWHARVCDESS